MGADLYSTGFEENRAKFEPKFKEWVRKRDRASTPEEKQKAQAKVEHYADQMYSVGYFRDSYNGSSILSAIGLSWGGDVIPLLDGNGNLTPAKAKKLKARIKRAKVPKITEEFCRRERLGLDETETVESWQKYFDEKKERLIAFLQAAIDANENIYCSL